MFHLFYSLISFQYFVLRRDKLNVFISFLNSLFSEVDNFDPGSSYLLVMSRNVTLIKNNSLVMHRDARLAYVIFLNSV